MDCQCLPVCAESTFVDALVFPDNYSELEATGETAKGSFACPLQTGLYDGLVA